jgi:hypothetical protein
MDFPLSLGLGFIGDASAVDQNLSTLIGMQGVGAYSDEADSYRVRELAALALVLAHSQMTLEAAGAGVFPQGSIELLTAHERRHLVPNDAARTEEQRQVRLAALARALRGASAVDIEAAVALLGITANIASITRGNVVTDGATPDAVFQLAFDVSDKLGAVDRRAAVDILRRCLPVMQYGHMGHASPQEMIVVSDRAKWDGTEVMGDCALAVGTSVQNRYPSRLKNYGPLSRLTARDLNAIQAQMLVSACNKTANSIQCKAGGKLIAFARHVSAGATVALETGDHRYRLARVVMHLAASTSDMRPGQTLDTLLNGSTLQEKLWYTGDGSSGYDAVFSDGSVLGGLRATASQIEFTSSSASAHTICGFIELSEDVRSGGRAPELTTFADGATLAANVFKKTWWEAVRDSAGVHRANGSVDNWSAFPSTVCGGVSRQFVLAHSVKPVSGANVFVADTTQDWRDRLLFIEAASVGLETAAPVGFPGGPSDTAFVTYPSSSVRVAYTGTGVAQGNTSTLPYHMQLDGYLRIGARDSDGALLIEHISTGDPDEPYSAALVIVHATDRLGVRSAATTIANPVSASDTTLVQSETLNGIQDAGMLTQGRAVEPVPGETPVPVDVMPLGPCVRGSPRVPIAFSLARRDGRKDQPRFERRQPVAGRLRRIFAVTVSSGASVVIDDANDWRDRFAVVFVAESGADIRPGFPQDDYVSSGAAAQHRMATYLGSGRSSGAYSSGDYVALLGGSTLVMSARASDGALEVRNDTGSTRYVVGWIEAGFPLGPRSV